RPPLLRELAGHRQRPDHPGRGAVLQGGEPRAPRAREDHDLPDVSQSLPGERRRDEAVRAVREVPGARVPGQTRPRAPPPDAAASTLIGRLLRVAVAVGLTAYILYKSPPRQIVAAAAGADWRPMAIAVALVLADRTLMAYRWIVLLCTIDPGIRPPLPAVMRI